MDHQNRGFIGKNGPKCLSSYYNGFELEFDGIQFLNT